ncbi:hypothetical protein CKALI_10540 [Corynebacterium kalinowskii]|uniref:Uncharacterized protein n=1 Tax=Corynebacterium kalinowskii TaxID=2675216 RepID=A0A6B8VIV4_9CORY|nr:hypothetical protein [Corynebacterium kalinowskii]QGU02959.1 hypothetical protein CKALI_10540 [Corynebacterium kalinowskii]
MSEKQLTVAELMARAAAEGRSDAPKRRRRRSLEDGGVSVAELTGNLPKVEAKPEEPRHTSEPIDAPEEAPVQAPAPVKAPAPAKAPVAEPVKQEPVKVEAPKPVAPKPEAPAKPESPKSVAPAKQVPLVSVVHDEDPIKLTTDSFPAQAAATKTEKPAAPAPKPKTQDAEETNVIPVVTETPEPKAPELESAEDTGEMPLVVDKPAELETVEEDGEETGRVSVASVLLMVVAGVAIGAAIFLGFKELWSNLGNVLVGVLAVAMTLGIVGIVHALRTERDGMSMVLAAVTGLALTFGPLLIVGL